MIQKSDEWPKGCIQAIKSVVNSGINYQAGAHLDLFDQPYVDILRKLILMVS